MKSLLELTMSDIMNRPVRHVLPDCTLSEAARLMKDANISSVLVMSNDIPLGILTERDLLRQINQHSDRRTPVSELMSSPLLTVSPETSFAVAYAQLLSHDVRHLVVVEDTGAVTGIASETDFRNHLDSAFLSRLDDYRAVMDIDHPQLTPDVTLDQALLIMERNRTPYALVVEDGLPVGILTERDMAGLLIHDAQSITLTLRDVMHSPVQTVSHLTPVFEMAGLMQAQKLRNLVVVDDVGQALGMVTLHKLMERIAATVMNEQTLRNQEYLKSGKQHAESLFHTIVQTIPDLVWVKDANGVFLSCNRMFERLYGAVEADIVGKTDYDFVEREQADYFREHDKQAMAAGKPSINEEWLTFADDGHRAFMETIKSPMLDTDGKLIGVLGIARDLTERRAAAEKIRQLTRLYATLSQCNQAIVRCTSEAELFQQICNDAVRFGGFKMAWIGMLDNTSKEVRPAASAGEGVEYLGIKLISADAGSPYGRGPTGTAIRENQPFWCQDFKNDPATLPWHERGARFGWGASAALPLRRSGIAVGAFTLYSSGVNAFDADSCKLLVEMAEDISFALDNFDREAMRENLEKQSVNERSVLELLARGEPLPDLLTHLTSCYENLYAGMLCSVLLLSTDGAHLRHGAAPSLPPAYCQAVDGVTIGDHVGSCGTAAYTRKTVIVSDIATDPRWQDYKELALGHGLAACWSVPIFSTQDKVLGTFALYYHSPRGPLPGELAALERGAHLASLAIERARNEALLTKLSLVVEQSPVSIVISDLNANIEYVNASFSRVTGYSLAEVIGKNPRILHSGKTPKATHLDMWAHLTAGRTWQGEFINRRKDGTEYTESVLMSPVRMADGQVTNYLAIKEDITEKKRAEARIQQLAHYDFLTGLPNQTLLTSRVAQSMSLAQRGNSQMAVMFLDLDHFKNVNDTLGHRIGDELLIQLAARLKSLLREEDTLSRMGGDEFILVLPSTDADGAAHVAEKILATVVQTFHIEQYELVVTPSIGIAMYPCDGMTFDKLYQSADVAMYRAKQEGRNGFRFFTAEMQEHSARRLLLENALRHAQERDQLQLHYQPQISMQDGRVVGAEALLRWEHPELGTISPTEFIPIAEESGLILSMGEWVLRTAVRQVSDWMKGGMQPLTVAVNLSAVQFRHPRLPDLVMEILREADLPAQYIALELTESVAMEEPLAAIAVMNNLHERGIRMAIDDFGTGYSSLSYLKKFKVHKLKIDQSFVCNISEDAESRAIVTAIITLANSLGFETIAEGVETAGQLAFLRLQGCNEVQGYYFSRPLSASQFEAYMRNQQRL